MLISELVKNKPVTRPGEAGPLTIGPVYHGTSAQFDQFEMGHAIGRLVSSLGGFCFTTNPMTASSYASNAAKLTGGKRRVVTAMLTMQRPYDITEQMRKLQRRKMSFGDAKNIALQAFDRNLYDGIVFRGNSLNPDEYVVFDPSQIKILS